MAITTYASRGNAGSSVLSKPTGTTQSILQNSSSNSEKKNRGGIFGGAAYLLEKNLASFVEIHEGAADYTFAGLAKLFGRDDWAESIIENDWFGDWYTHADRWYNPGEGMQVAGAVASGIGTSAPGMGVDAIVTYFTGSKALGAAASTFAVGLGAAGRATKEAYEKTGQLTGKEFGYGALSGLSEGAIEGASSLIGTGGGAVVKNVVKALGKETGESFAKQGIKTLASSFFGEAFEEGLSEYLDPYWKRLTYDPKAENATADEVIYAGLVGGLSGMVMGGGGYVIDSANSYSIGNKLSISGGDAEVLETSGYFSAFEESNHTGDEIFSEIVSRRKTLLESLQKTGGKAVTMQQKRELGALSRANVAAGTKMFVAREAQNIVNNADVIAQRLTAYGYKSADGKPIRYTAEEITKEYDPKRPETIYSAIQNNEKLRTLAVSSATGRLMMDTNQFMQATLAGERLASQVDINRFYETASKEEIRAVSMALGIDSWSSLTPEIFNQKIADFLVNGGAERSIEQREKKAAFASLASEGASPIPKAINLADGIIRRFSDGQLDVAVERKGRSYSIYNYDTDTLSKEMTVDEVNGFFRDYTSRMDEYAEARRSAIEEEQRRITETREIDTLLRESVADYKNLNAPNQSMIRRLVREGRVKGVSDSDLLMYAKVSAHSGIDIVFDKEATKVKNKAGEDTYRSAFYEWQNNRITVNPESKSGAERILIHELDHAVRNYFGKDGQRMTKVFDRALSETDESTRKKILEKSEEVAKPGELENVFKDEVNSYFAERMLTNKQTLERIVEAEPGLKDKILTFFKGASSDYADVPKLSGSAKWYYKKFKKMFDEFSARNAQSNANEKTLTSMNQENMQVSDRQYALSQAFTKELQDWFDTTSEEERAKSGNRFLVGTTSTVLKNIGVREGNIYFGGSKINKILKNNDSMTLDIIKQAVNLIEDPILVMKSKTVEDSLVLFGEVYTAGGKPVMLSLLYNPKNGNGEILDYSVITSAYGRKINNLQNLINTSKIYYVNEQKNRTDTWLKALGLQLPSALTKLGSIDSIPQTEPKSNSSDEISLENSSDKQMALDIDSEGDNISGAEVNEAAKPKKKSTNPKKKKAKTAKQVERTLENEKARLKADYTTDKVFSQASVERGFAKVEAIKKLPKEVRENIARDLWLDLEASDGDDVRGALPIEYSVKLYQAIRDNDSSELTAAQRDALQAELRDTVSEIINLGKDSKWQKQKANVRGAVKIEERVGSEYKSKIYQNLRKIKDRKYRRFIEASAYKGDVFKGSIDDLTKIDWRGKFSANIARHQIKKLSEWYTEDNPMFKLEKTGDENSKIRLTTNFNDSIRYMIDMLSEGEGDFTNSELRILSDLTEYFAKLVDEFDKVYVEGKWQDGEPIAREMIDTIKKQEGLGVPVILRALRNKITSAGFRIYGDPLSVMKLADMYDNGIYTRYYNEWMRAEINADAEALRIKAKYDEFMKENPKFLKNAETETVDLHGKQVRKIDLISYAMTLKRKQAWESIAEGGVVFRRYEKGILGKPKVAQEIKIYPTAEIEKGDGYRARLETAMSAEYDNVMKLLSERDVQYMKVLEEGFELARETKALGDMQRLGFVSVITGYYYPIKHVDTGHLSEMDLELIATDRYANASFNKNATEGAKSAIMITSADATFNSHVKGVSRYLYLSPVMDSFNKLYKLQIGKNAEVNAESVIKADGRDSMTTLQRTIAESKTTWRDGKTGVPVGFEYLQNMMLDTMGMGKNVGDDFFSTIRSGSVGFALGANPKVLVTQLSSLISSTSVLTYKSHLGALGIWSGGMDNYSDVARLRNSDYTIAKAEGVVDNVSRFSKVFTSLIGVMDRFVVFRAWAAAQAEVAQKGGPAVGTEENRIKAGKLLDKVILETQQNSLTSRRTEGARRGNLFTKSVQMYKSDAITSFGRVIDGWGEMSYVSALLKNDSLSDAERTKLKAQLDGAKTKFAKAVGSVTMQAMFLLIVNEMFRNFYGKNDDETEEEKKARLLVDGIGNLIGGMPIVSEVYSVFTSNYGFEPMEMSSVNDFFDTAKSVIDYVEKSNEGKITDRDTNKMVRTVLYSGGQLIGVPLRNIRNLMYGTVRLFDKDAAYKWDNAVYKKNYSADLTKALEDDDMERATMIMELALGEKLGSGFSDASIRELASLVANGEKVIPSAISDTITIDGEEYVLEAEQYAAVKEGYNGVISAVNSLVDSNVYKSYTTEQKAKVLRKLYSTYKDIAYDRVLETQRNVRANLISSLLSEDTFNSYIALSAIESDVDAEGNTISGSKRAKVVQAISSLGVSVEERLLLICASGYALKDGDVRGLSAEGAKTRLLKYILKYKGLSADERLALAEMCGFEVKNGRIVNNFSKNLKKLSKK